MTQHHYKGALLGKIWLENGYRRHTTKWGEGTSYDDLDGLSSAITNYLCLSPHQLVGEDVRYLRRRLDLTQDALGAELGVTGQAVAKWEKGDVAAIPMAAARLLRLLVLARTAPDQRLSAVLAEYNEPPPEKLVFRHSPEMGWQCADHHHGTVTVLVKRTSNVFDFADVLMANGYSVRIDAEALCSFANNDKESSRHASKLAAA